jgi:hypothetical protein
MAELIDLYDELLDELIEKEESGIISNLADKYSSKLREFYLPKNLVVDEQLLKLYKDLSDGINISWSTEERKGVEGNLNFMQFEHIVADQRDRLYNADDVERGNDICYFHPIDLITPEAECGFYYHPEERASNHCMYYHESGKREIHSLDLDFIGYFKMACESKVFFYWPKVLLNIQGGGECAETIRFKKEMPKLFEDFTWDKFVSKYESLRLSNNKGLACL